ncbi:MAG: 2-amino-4-hydroxy-6-hydroxymethyldihydropteridine diphosphokinase [Paludibacteraceae bacterium]|nr:2-amino-4-hydroxy-6-hydroxymethyldihydropteridine diphosphokinase [Paludibacteraceae bacterium]
MTYYLSLGSNVGNREQHLIDACSLLNLRCGTILRQSAFFHSEPWGYTSSHPYINICVALSSSMPPFDLLDATEQIERELGRVQKGIYADRTIDIDLLLCYKDDGTPVTMQTPRLTIPHIHMHERDFVQIPLKEIFIRPLRC